MSTLDLIVAEFQNGCRQMDLALACVLPLELSAPGFQSGVRWLDERAEVWGYTGPEMAKRIDSEGRS